MRTRKEKDFIGTVKVPSDAYYGSQAQRARENFPITVQTLQKEFFQTYVILKKAAAVANMKTKKLDPKIGKAIIRACDEIIHGKFLDQFIVGIYQAGAGTSTNMNVNEVIANRASEILGKPKGKNFVEPHDHVNLSQSTNDTFHSVIHITAYKKIKKELIPALQNYQKVLNRKVKEFKKIKKSGRTHLMHAVPLTLGQELSGNDISDRITILRNTAENLLLLPLGGTAIGTGINADKNYSSLAIKEISKYTGYHFKRDNHHFASIQNLNSVVEVSGVLKSLAISFINVANDLRLLSSSDINEIKLPAVQPGSSIMPGKVNPSIPEMLDMICFQVIGNDLTITMASQAGQLELNVFMPIVAHNIIDSIDILSNGVEVFTEKCLAGIKANKGRIKENLDRNPMVATKYTKKYGYDKVAKVVDEAIKKRKNVSEILKSFENDDK